MTGAGSLFVWMAREEWRLHADLFGGRRFAAFPVFVTAVVAGGAVFFAMAGTDAGTIVAAVHALVFVFGLQVGTVGLVGGDAMENLVGDVTLLVFSARALPVSWRRLLAVFLLTDAVYYVGLFLTPMVVGLAALGLYRPESGLLAAIPLLWATTVGTFALGLSVSFALVSLYTRSRAATLAGAGAVGVGVWLGGPDLLALTPYGVYAGDRPLAAVAASLSAVAAATAVGLALFRPDRRSSARTATDRFDRLRGRLPGDDHGLVTKSLLDVARSSGGPVKVVFSQGLVFGVVWVVLGNVRALLPVRPDPGVTFGALLALGSFTTYNWLTGTEETAFYLRQPVGLGAVFRAKLAAFLLLGLPTGTLYLLVAGLRFGPATLLSGLPTLAALALYFFGVTAYLAGLDPNALLFDTAVFAAFAGATAAAVVPVLIAAFAAPEYPTAVAAFLAVALPAVAAAGLLLARRAPARWTTRLTA